ncbi:uncharacterized protein LOC131166909 [Malania oleifera]|uniref:uncharacterized protein LOC131166909 n=1 Tax=Malania oleifera TaxID=397392 RepID=UPI0025AE5AA6|nr:uncharacterized protein LOC131166909 [Malania oleifera]
MRKNMLGLTSLSHSPIPIPIPIPNPIPSISRPLPLPLLNNHLTVTYSASASLLCTQTSKNRRRFAAFAENGNSGLSREPKGGRGDDEEEERKEPKMNGRLRFNLRWGDLLEPNPDNILAIGLTGVLAWASVQVLWQIFFVSLAILLAALKYSFVAALLIFILIALL